MESSSWIGASLLNSGLLTSVKACGCTELGQLALAGRADMVVSGTQAAVCSVPKLSTVRTAPNWTLRCCFITDTFEGI